MIRKDELLAAIQPLKAFAKKYGYEYVTASYTKEEKTECLHGYTFDEPHDKDVDVLLSEEVANERH